MRARCHLRLQLATPTAPEPAGDRKQRLVEGGAGHRGERAGRQHAVMLARVAEHPDIPTDRLGVRDGDLLPGIVGGLAVEGHVPLVTLSAVIGNGLPHLPDMQPVAIDTIEPAPLPKWRRLSLCCAAGSA